MKKPLKQKKDIKIHGNTLSVVVLFFTLCFLNFANAQNKTITGVVYDSNGPLPGATITIKGNTAKGTQTDLDGNYSITVSGSEDILVFQYLGFLKQEVIVGNQTTINITLQEDIEKLQEVVVVGYGVQKKVNLTGAVTSIDGEELTSKPMSDARQALQGAIPGLTIIDRGGNPGDEALNFNIRGVGSISAGTNPLILIDGIESTLSQINPNDISTVSVLKDAASSSIYGSRAANGVVLITTKRGDSGDYHLDYHGYIGFQTPATLPELVEAKDYLSLVNEALVNAGQAPKYSQEYINNTVAGNDPINYPYVNLFEELFKDGFVQNHSFSVRGGNDKTRLALSVNYLDQDGMLTNTGSTKIGARLNADLQLKDGIRFRSNLYYNRRKANRPNRYNEAIGAMVGTSPVTVLKYPNGAYGLNKDNTNALAALEVSGINTRNTDEFSLNLGLDLDLAQGLQLKTDYSYIEWNTRWKRFRAAYQFRDPDDLSSVIYTWNPNELQEERWEEGQWNLKSILSYSKSFAEHEIKLLGGIDIIENKRYSLFASRQNIFTQENPELNLGDVESKENSGFAQDWALMSYLGRINYVYDGKYLLEGNIRYDGSSRFGKGNKWGVFPSFSIGWRISEESFMEPMTFLNNLKLRGSWGQLGNQNIGLYRFTSSVVSQYPYSFNDNEVDGYSQRFYANEDITWETTEMTNVGLDAALFQSKLNVTLDWFKKDTKDMLLILPISFLVGLEPSEINRGSVQNKGWELAANYRNNDHQFKYGMGFNITMIDNKITDFGGNEPSINGWTILKEGEPINAFFGYKTEGLFQSQEEIDNHAEQPNHSSLKPGDIKMIDINNDGIINDDDRTVIGNPIPKYTYSFNLNADYKNFDLNLFFQGAAKVDNYFYGAPNEGPAFEIFTTTRVLDRWTPDNPDASFPRLEAASNKNNFLYNDFWIRDASYLRLKNIQLGYSFPEEILEKLRLNQLRIYFGATNLFTITDVESGLDPETYSGRPNYYPPVSTYTVGVQFNF